MGSANCGKTPKNPSGFAMAAALAGFLFSCPVAGQQSNWSVHPALQDRWTLELGAYTPKVKTTATLNNATQGAGTTVSFEDELGLSDRETMGTFLARMRLGERWRIEAEYFSLDRSGSRAIARTINWGGTVYNVGTVVTSEFNSDIFRLSGGYSFIKNTQYEVGGTLGLHVTDFTASLAAAGVGAKGGDALAPLPTIGMYGAYAFTPKWLLSGRVDYFSLKYDAYGGSLKNLTAGVDYRFHRNFGAGLGYRYVDYTLEATKASFTGEVRYQFSGPVLYAVGSF
jgi:hypothetical protein